MQNSDRIWPYKQYKVIDLGVSRKLTYDFLLVFLAVSASVFDILMVKQKMADFPHPNLFEAPAQGLRISGWNLSRKN